MRPFLYIEVDGVPVVEPDAHVAAAWYDNTTNRQVALDTVAGLTVSTVFLPCDHNFSGVGPPVLYETMIFGGFEDYQERYTTRALALAGHAAAIAKVVSGEVHVPLFDDEERRL